MPAKTVVFSSVTKYDGMTFRLLSCGEYVQMSGRAGRRGKDKKGATIMMLNSTMEPIDAQKMLRGVADRLTSEFHLGYNMLLNLTRIEGIEAQYLIHRSFLQFGQSLQTPEVEGKIEKLNKELEGLIIDHEET
eukprot:UN34706